MSKWSNWIDIETAIERDGPFNHFGIYQIRAVAPSGKPIPINRLAGVDLLGILYIGRSGYQYTNKRRTVANRIREFIQQRHSGGKTYAKAKVTLQRTQLFTKHRLQVRAKSILDREINQAESQALHTYISKHAELPPCNSSLTRAVKITLGI